MDLAQRRDAGGGDPELIERLASWHPLRVRDWPVTPALAYFAKALTLGLISQFFFLGPLHFVPFVEALDRLGTSPWVPRLWKGGFAVACFGILFNRWPRASVLLLSGLVLYELAASRVSYHNNTLFVAIALLMIGLSSRAVGGWLVRCQVAVVYFGAAVDKALAPWWRDGSFMDNWLRTLDHVIYVPLADAMPDRLVALVGSWAAILTEFALAAGVLIPPLAPWVAWVGSTFHAGTLFLSGATFGLFMVGMITSYLCFADLDEPMRIRVGGPDALRPWLERVRAWTWPDRAITVEAASASEGWLVVERADRRYRGAAGLGLLAIFNPAVYLGFLVFIATGLIPMPVKIVFLVLAIGASLPLIAAVTFGWTRR